MLTKGYYVTVKDAGHIGFLLGPFGTHREALANVDLGRDLADAHNDRAWFMAYGTARVKTDIPQGKPAVFADHACQRCTEV